jgi:hypothetical protein
MVHTFKSLRDQVLAFIGESDDTVTDAMVKDVMNQAHMNRVTQHKWAFMTWPRTETLSILTTTRQYALHQEFGKAIWFYNETGGWPMVETPERTQDGVAPDYTSGSESPKHFKLAGTMQVKQQPSTTGTCTIESSSASDNSSTYNIYIKGVTSTDDVVQVTVTPNGVTPVATSVAFKHILMVSKAADWNGTLTLKDNAGNTLLTLYAGEWGRTYRIFELLADADAAATIKYQFRVKVQKLVNDYDVPQLPDNHAQILVYDTLLLLAGALGNVPEGFVSEWKDMQTRLERNLYLEYGFDQNTLNAGPSYIKFTGDY